MVIDDHILHLWYLQQIVVTLSRWLVATPLSVNSFLRNASVALLSPTTWILLRPIEKYPSYRDNEEVVLQGQSCKEQFGGVWQHVSSRIAPFLGQSC